MKREKAFSYLRVSGKGQGRGDGFPRQRLAIKTYADRNRIEIVEEFKDEGVSGTKESADRLGLSDLVCRVRANGVRLAIVERADRLSRDLIVGELILQELEKLGVKVIDSSGNDLSALDGDPTKRLIRQILAAVAEFDKTSIVMKLRVARMRKRQATGRCEGRRPFGDRAGESETLARLSELNRKPRNKPRPAIRAIADSLNREGRATRGGGPWTAGSVHAILKRRKGM